MKAEAGTRPLRVAVAASGGGRSLKNLLEAQSSCAYRVSAFISSKAETPAEALALAAELPLFRDRFPFEAPRELGESLEAWLIQQRIDLVALAGFLRPFPMLPFYARKIVNIHPALLPSYGGKGMYGIHVHRAVHAAREVYSGATVHFVTEGYDEGAIIAQNRVDISDLESAEAIADRVFQAECRLYPLVIDGLSKGTLPLESGRVLELEENIHGVQPFDLR